MSVRQRKSGRNKLKQAGGVVSNCSSRVAKSGSQAHSFQIGKNTFTVFTNDELSPVTTGDRVRFDYEVRRLKSGYRNEYFAVVEDTLIIEAPNELGADITGQVYILSNPSMAGLVKVGYTTGDATDRAAALSGVTSVPTGFKVEWSLAVIGNPREVEQRAHAHLAKHRTGKEFFRVSLDQAKAACIQSFAELYPERAKEMDAAFVRRADEELTRRGELARLKVEREKAREEEAQRKVFEESREGRWLTGGCVRVVLRDFSYEPNRGYPTFFGKLIRKKYENFLEMTVRPYQDENDLKWSFGASGRLSEKYVQESKSSMTQDECIKFATDFARERNVGNYRLCIEISNIYIEQPPELPEDYRNPAATLGISNLDGLVIRPARVIHHRGGRKQFVR